MSDVINNLRNSRKNPSVLQLRLISVRSSLPDDLIFIFEGLHDVGVYDSWIAKSTAKPAYEAIAGNGKEQLLGLRNQLRERNSQLIEKVHFFVDCDFDEFPDLDEHVFTLGSYSIENVICSKETLASILCDEFRCAGLPLQRDRILQEFDKICGDFKSATYDLNFWLYLARQKGLRVVRKPETLSEIADISLGAVVSVLDEEVNTVVLDGNVSEEEIREVKNKFAELPDSRAHRGKYLLLMFRKWLGELMADAKLDRPKLFDRKTNFSGDPSAVSMRRMAMASKIPNGLDEFISSAVRRASLRTVPDLGCCSTKNS